MLLDLVKCFEQLRYNDIWKAGRRHGYPLALLRLSLASYRAGRLIFIEGVVGDLVRASRGIVAGLAFATAELRLLLLYPVFALQRGWPR